MNKIASFRLCKLSDEELLQKVDEGTDNIFKTGVIPSCHIPARPDSDYDLLIGELLLRFKERLHPSPSAPVVAEDVNQAIHNLLKTIPVDNGNVYVSGFKEAVYALKLLLDDHSPAERIEESDAVDFGEWILSEKIISRDTNWFDAGKHHTTKELYQTFKKTKP